MRAEERPHAETVRRACLPELLLAEDIASALRITVGAARKAIREGRCGPFVKIGRRLAVRRDAFMEALARRETKPDRAGRPPRGRAKYVHLLRGKQETQ